MITTPKSVGMLTAVALAALIGTSPANADVREVDPCGGTTIDGVLVSGSVWLAGCTGTTKRSADGGATWHPTTFQAFFANAPTVPDGTGGFLTQDGAWLYRMDSAGTITKVPSSPGVGYVALDGSGQLWGLSCPAFSSDGGPWKLYSINRNTGVANLVADGGAQYGCGSARYRKPLRVDVSGQVFIPDGPNSRLVPNGSGGFTVEPLAPFATSGGVTLSEGGVGGLGWDPGMDISPLPGQPDYVLLGDEGLARNAGPGVWSTTGRRFAAVTTEGVLIPSRDGTRLQVVTGSLDSALLVSDPQPADSQRMLDEGTRLRSEAGLTIPLLGDVGIARAASNHAHYWTLNDPTNQGLGLHGETPGRAGFTGTSPQDRCAATETNCSWEVMYPGQSDEAQAVQGWMATVYHRTPFVQPGMERAGGSLINHMAVLDSTHPTGFAGRPVGYPNSTYSGPLSFSGELPDPGQDCRQGTGTVRAPYGTAVSVSPPFDNGYLHLGSTAPDAITVTDSRGNKLAGCTVHDELIDAFLPDDALQPGTTYTARASWSGRFADYQWTFTTTGVPDPAASTPKRKRTLRIRVTKRAPNRIGIDVNPDTTTAAYRLRVQRHAKRWTTLKRVKVAAPRHRTMVRLPKAGRYRVLAPAQAGLKAGRSRTLPIR